MHNCETCKHWEYSEAHSENWCFHPDTIYPSKTHYEMRHDPEPQNQHPCDHGDAIVATAIAGVEFEERLGRIIAIHVCKIPNREFGHTPPMKMIVLDFGFFNRFCCDCGLRLPTAQQLPAMYEAWKESRCSTNN